jgi:SAM-dependent methyltransferase
MSRGLRTRWRKEQFDPGWLGPFVNPFFLARRSLWRAIRESAPHLGGQLLDVGCGTKPYRELFQVEHYVGLDIDTEATRRRGSADLLYDGNAFPVPDGQFDSLLCNQVLEHVFAPDSFVAELNRALKPGGQLLLTVPFVWDEHEQPFDYARYSSFGLASLLQRHGFVIIEQRKLMADFSLIFQLVNAYLYKLVRPWPFAARAVFCVVVMAPVTILGLVFGTVLPRNHDLFLDQLVLARKP